MRELIPRKQIVDLPVYQPGKPIEEVKKQLGLNKVVKLASNENPFGCSPRAKEAILSELDRLAYYPDGGAIKLRTELARFLGVEREQVIVGNGSDELLMLTTRAYLEPGARTVMATPTFPVYKTTSTIEGAEVIEVPLTDGTHDLDAMLAQIDERTRVVWICNPNNPTGTIVSEEALRSFLDRAPSSTLVVIDEAYYEYVTDQTYPNSLALLRDYPNIIVFRTFSKIYGLARLRIGYGVASEDVIDKINRVREPFNTSGLAQAAALAALGDQSFVEECRDLNKLGQEQLYRGFDELGLNYYRTNGNFVLVETGKNGNDIFESLLKRGFIVRSGVPLGFPTAIRVTIGSESQNAGLLQALGEVLAL